MATEQIKMEGKIWGRVRHIVSSPEIAISYLEVTTGTRSSIHLHRNRQNAFFPLSGLIVIEWWPDGYQGRVLRQVLGDGCTLTVPAGIHHRFRVIASGTMVEVYTPHGGSVSIDDIERLDEGGEDREFAEAFLASGSQVNG